MHSVSVGKVVSFWEYLLRYFVFFLIDQFLFRKCCGGPNNDCTEPVIAWTATTRCPQHADLDSVFPITVVKEDEAEEGETEGLSSHFQNHFQGPPSHPLLVEYLRKRRHDQAFN